MLSVVKFPVVRSVVKRVKENNGSFADSLYVDKAMLHNDTYSPMLQKYPNTESHRIAIVELVDYAMRVSDNNACDILMDFVGGASVVDGYIKELGIEGINVKWDENEMHLDEERFRENTSTPMAMAQLMFKFDNDFEDVNSLNIKEIMESCETGTDRLAKSLISTNAVIGHKTGTGPIDKKTGRLMAVNDAGYIHLSNGKRYSIAVFIADSGYSMAETSAIIAKISEIVRDGLIVQLMKRSLYCIVG